MERIKRPKKLKSIGSKKTVNDDRPPKAVPVPPRIIAKFSNRIGSVWWFAKGRDKDPTIGVEIDGIRKTYGGYTWNDWWYFMKAVHRGDDNEMPQCYWYRKRKIPKPDNPDDYEIIEEYVGVRLQDLDTGYDLDIPDEIKHDIKDLCY